MSFKTKTNQQKSHNFKSTKTLTSSESRIRSPILNNDTMINNYKDTNSLIFDEFYDNSYLTIHDNDNDNDNNNNDNDNDTNGNFQAINDNPFKVNHSEMIKVYIRIKPNNTQQQQEKKTYQAYAENRLSIIDDNSIDILNSEGIPIKSLTYDHIFNEKSDQEQIFQITTAPLINHSLKGSNATIFVYGQTGTGKTYTMGLTSKLTKDSQGIIPNTLRYLFNYFENTQQTQGSNHYQWEITINILQIYLEDILDLLNPGKQVLQIRQNPHTHETYVQDLITASIKTLDQAIELINAGLENRAIASQRLNQNSSRSHLILTFDLIQRFQDSLGLRINANGNGSNGSIGNDGLPNRGNEMKVESRLTLIDLAGSERVRKTTAVGLRLEEAKAINSSLSALANVINALGSKARTFIPYRESKLTRILQNSLNPNSKISLIATISQSQANINETISTLMFASRCLDVQIKNHANILGENLNQNGQYEELMKKMQDQIDNITQTYSEREKQYLAKIRFYETELNDYKKLLHELNPSLPSKASSSLLATSGSSLKGHLDSNAMEHNEATLQGILDKIGNLKHRNEEYLDIIHYIMKLFAHLDKLCQSKIQEVLDYRKAYIDNHLQANINQILQGSNYNITQDEINQYMHENLDYIQELDKIYPTIDNTIYEYTQDHTEKSRFTSFTTGTTTTEKPSMSYNNSNDKQMLHLDLLEVQNIYKPDFPAQDTPTEEILSTIQALAKSIINNINKLSQNSINTERLKYHLYAEKLKEDKRKDELDVWSTLVNQLIMMNKQNLELLDQVFEANIQRPQQPHPPYQSQQLYQPCQSYQPHQFHQSYQPHQLYQPDQPYQPYQPHQLYQPNQPYQPCQHPQPQITTTLSYLKSEFDIFLTNYLNKHKNLYKDHEFFHKKLKEDNILAKTLNMLRKYSNTASLHHFYQTIKASSSSSLSHEHSHLDLNDSIQNNQNNGPGSSPNRMKATTTKTTVMMNTAELRNEAIGIKEKRDEWGLANLELEQIGFISRLPNSEIHSEAYLTHMARQVPNKERASTPSHPSISQTSQNSKLGILNHPSMSTSERATSRAKRDLEIANDNNELLSLVMQIKSSSNRSIRDEEELLYSSNGSSAFSENLLEANEPKMISNDKPKPTSNNKLKPTSNDNPKPNSSEKPKMTSNDKLNYPTPDYTMTSTTAYSQQRKQEDMLYTQDHVDSMDLRALISTLDPGLPSSRTKDTKDANDTEDAKDIRRILTSLPSKIIPLTARSIEMRNTARSGLDYFDDDEDDDGNLSIQRFMTQIEQANSQRIASRPSNLDPKLQSQCIGHDESLFNSKSIHRDRPVKHEDYSNRLDLYKERSRIPHDEYKIKEKLYNSQINP